MDDWAYLSTIYNPIMDTNSSPGSPLFPKLYFSLPRKKSQDCISYYSHSRNPSTKIWLFECVSDSFEYIMKYYEIKYCSYTQSSSCNKLFIINEYKVESLWNTEIIWKIMINVINFVSKKNESSGSKYRRKSFHSVYTFTHFQSYDTCLICTGLIKICS